MTTPGRMLLTSPWALTLVFTLPFLGLALLFSPLGVESLGRQPGVLDWILLAVFSALSFIAIWTGLANRLLVTEAGDVLWTRTGMLWMWPVLKRQLLKRTSLASIAIVHREMNSPVFSNFPTDFLALRLIDGHLLRLSPLGTLYFTDSLRRHGEKLASALALPMEVGTVLAPDDFWK